MYVVTEHSEHKGKSFYTVYSIDGKYCKTVDGDSLKRQLNEHNCFNFSKAGYLHGSEKHLPECGIFNISNKIIVLGKYVDGRYLVLKGTSCIIMTAIDIVRYYRQDLCVNVHIRNSKGRIIVSLNAGHMPTLEYLDINLKNFIIRNLKDKTYSKQKDVFSVNYFSDLFNDNGTFRIDLLRHVNRSEHKESLEYLKTLSEFNFKQYFESGIAKDKFIYSISLLLYAARVGQKYYSERNAVLFSELYMTILIMSSRDKEIEYDNTFAIQVGLITQYDLDIYNLV